MTLLIDTTQEEAHVGVAHEGVVHAVRSFPADKQLGTRLITEIDAVLSAQQVTPNQLTGVVVHPGPGRFMATRTGTVTGTVLAQALGCELREAVGTSLEQMLAEAEGSEPVLTITPRYDRPAFGI